MAWFIPSGIPYLLLIPYSQKFILDKKFTTICVIEIWVKTSPDENFQLYIQYIIFITFCIGFAEAQFRQYERLTRQMEPDLEAYERQKQEMGEDFFPGVNTLLHGTSKVSQAGVDRMAADLEKQWVGVCWGKYKFYVGIWCGCNYTG